MGKGKRQSVMCALHLPVELVVKNGGWDDTENIEPWMFGWTWILNSEGPAEFSRICKI